jgi:hypothetical protein
VEIDKAAFREVANRPFSYSLSKDFVLMTGALFSLFREAVVDVCHHLKAAWRFIGLTLALMLGVSSVAHAQQARVIVLHGASAEDRFAAVAAGKALVEAVKNIASGDTGTTISIEGNFVINEPLRICHVTNFRLTSPQRSAVILAGGVVPEAIDACGVTGLRIDGVTIENFSQNGILVTSSRGTEIDQVRVRNTLSEHWSEAAIHLMLNSTGAYLHDNVVDGADYAGIMVDTDEISDVSHVRIEKIKSFIAAGKLRTVALYT